MKDSFGRNVHSMRISVTDRCNMRCDYCVSGDKLQLRPAQELLSLEEIETIVRAAGTLGFDTFRFTESVRYQESASSACPRTAACSLGMWTSWRMPV